MKGEEGTEYPRLTPPLGVWAWPCLSPYLLPDGSIQPVELMSARTDPCSKRGYCVKHGRWSIRERPCVEECNLRMKRKALSAVAPGTRETLIKEHISALIQLTSRLQTVALFDHKVSPVHPAFKKYCLFFWCKFETYLYSKQHSRMLLRHLGALFLGERD